MIAHIIPIADGSSSSRLTSRQDELATLAPSEKLGLNNFANTGDARSSTFDDIRNRLLESGDRLSVTMITFPS